MRIRIRAGQKHADPADPDPKPWKKVAQLLRCQTFYKGRVPLHFDFHEESEASMGVLRK